MVRHSSHCPKTPLFALVLIVLCSVLTATAQCPGSTLISGLRGPSKLVQTQHGNLLVAETGTATPNSGRVSIVGLDGTRRTLLAGLPSGMNSMGDGSGTQGVHLVGRTLYVLNGEGNATLAGPIDGTEIPNPNPNSPILSSVLAVHFSSAAERITNGFVLTLADHQALKDGETLTFDNGGADKLTVKLIADFPNFVPDPLPFFGPNVRHSNPFGVLAIDDNLYISDGGRNLVFEVDIPTGATSVLATFPSIPNPLPFGPPFIEAVPDSVRAYNGHLLVSLLRGFPFPAGASSIVRVNRTTGAVAPFITGLTSGIDVLPVRTKSVTRFLTLEVSVDLLNGDLGRLQRFSTPAGPGIPISTCLIGPSNMARDEKTRTLYIAEIFSGRIVRIPGL